MLRFTLEWFKAMYQNVASNIGVKSAYPQVMMEVKSPYVVDR